MAILITDTTYEMMQIVLHRTTRLKIAPGDVQICQLVPLLVDFKAYAAVLLLSQKSRFVTILI